MNKKIGFWRWWFKETLFWWGLCIGLILLTIFMILGLIVNKWFLLIPFWTIGILSLLWFIMKNTYVVSWWKSVKKYFRKRKDEYKNFVEEGQ